MRRGVGRLVQVDEAVANILLQRPLQRRAAARDGRVVPGSDMELVIILRNTEQKSCADQQEEEEAERRRISK